MIKRFAGRVPVLGVCLGHQCLGFVYGGEIVRAERILHGKTSQIIHQGRGLFAGLENPFPATRYHSLLVRRDTLPQVLEVVAWTVRNRSTISRLVRIGVTGLCLEGPALDG